MPVTRPEETASERGRRVIEILCAHGTRLGFEVAREYPVQGGRLDVVWLAAQGLAIPGFERPLPAVGFEVESSWRTRKHIKGDYLNLADLSAGLGVIVLLGDGEEVEATRRFAETLVDRPGPRILVWSEQDVHRLATHDPQTPTLAPDNANPAPSGGQHAAGDGTGTPQGETNAHAGKYRALWAWLRNQTSDRFSSTFTEIEEIIGMPLPPSSRRHPAHWHGFEGSAVARAIRDAGWTVRDLDIPHERLTFVRLSK